MVEFQSVSYLTNLLVFFCLRSRRSIDEIPRMKVEKEQTIETLTNEEALLLAKFLRNETDSWYPRIVLMEKVYVL